MGVTAGDPKRRSGGTRGALSREDPGEGRGQALRFRRPEGRGRDPHRGRAPEPIALAGADAPSPPAARPATTAASSRTGIQTLSPLDPRASMPSPTSARSRASRRSP